jgi:heat shock protein HslJ
MRRTTSLLLAALLGLAALAGCGDDGDDVRSNDPGAGGDIPGTEPATGVDPLPGRTFATTTPSGLVEGTSLEIAFADDGTVRITAGCNQLSGPYTVDGDVLTVADLAGTEMACDPPLMEQDERIRAFFAEPVGWHLDTGILSLDGAGEESFTLRDEAAAGEQQELVGPTWRLDTITDGETASSVPAGVEASITFAADGTYELAAGCNAGSGTYVGDGGSIQIDRATLTQRRCDDAATQVESAMVAVLDGEVSTSVVGGRLTIADTGGGDPDEDGGRGGDSLGFVAG